MSRAMAVDPTALGVVLVFVIVVWGVVLYARRVERARTERWLEHMRHIGRRCPDCGGMGFHFGPPGTGDPAVSTPACRTCDGAGELA